MTDNEIKKALECCKNDGIICIECPYKKANGCMEKLSADALDLINRLQAENEDLKSENLILSQKRFNIFESLEFGEKIKAEAYKEFAEKAVEQVEKARQKYQRLCEEQGEEMEEHMYIHFNGITKIINNLFKKMVGENND